MTNIGTSLSASLQSRAQNLHANSKQLEKQQKDVVKAAEGLRKENEKLKKVVDEGSRKVKELGNVQNWAEMLERDFLVLQETVRLANGEEDSDWSGSYSGSEWSGSEQGDGVDESAGTVAVAKDVRDAEGDTRMDDVSTEHVKGKQAETTDLQAPLSSLPPAIEGGDSIGKGDLAGSSAATLPPPP